MRSESGIALKWVSGHLFLHCEITNYMSADKRTY